MLFYKKYKSQSDISEIPDSYIVIDVSSQNSKISKIHHPNLTRLEIVPDRTKSKKDDKELLEDLFVHNVIIEYTNHLTVISNYLINHSHSASVVVICNNDDVSLYGINTAKLICKFIEQRYEYKAFKFTNTIVKTMRDESKFTETGLLHLVKDLNKVKKKIK
jgi:hypothetical protein